MQHQCRRQKSEGVESFFSNNGNRRGAAPNSYERSSASLSQLQPQSREAEVDMLESRQRINLSRSYGSGRQSDAKPKHKQLRRCSDSNIPERESDSSNASDRKRLEASSSGLRNHTRFLQQLPFESRAKSEAEASFTSPRHQRKSCSGSTPLLPPSPSSISRSSQQHAAQYIVRRSHLPRQNVFRKGVDVKHQLPPPPPRRMSEKTQTQASDKGEAASSLHSCATYEYERIVEDAATSQLRKLCLDIIKSAEEGTSTPNRAEIKKVVVEYHRDNSNSPKHEGDIQAFRRSSESDSDRKRLELEASRNLGHFQQHPFGSRAQAKATSSSTSPRPYYDSNYTPPPLPFIFVKDTVKRSAPPKRSKSKGINLNDLQPPSRRLTTQSTQSSEPESDAVADVSLLLQRPTPSPSNQGRSTEKDAAMSQLRNICMHIVRSAEEGKPPPPRAQIKKVITDYHRTRNNPISPRHPNFTEIPTEFSRLLTYGLARSQTVQQTTTEPSQRRSRFGEIKDEGQQVNESRLYTTVEVGPSDVESCVSLPTTIDDVFSVKK